MIVPVSLFRVREWVEEPKPLGLVRVEEMYRPTVSRHKLNEEQRTLLGVLSQEYKQYRKTSGSLVSNVNKLINMLLVGISAEESSIPWEKRRDCHEHFQKVITSVDLTERLRGLHILFDKFAHHTFESDEVVPRAQTPKQPPPPAVDEWPYGRDNVEDAKKYLKKIKEVSIPEVAMSRFKEELNRFTRIPSHSAEHSVARTYLEVFSSYPWGVSTVDKFDMAAAQTILDEAHYGMDDIKQRILQVLAVGKLQGKVAGKILCFIGPPGVGKSSIGESIAKSVPLQLE